MKKEFIITFVVGLVFVILLSIPRINSSLIYNTKLVRFIILQPLFHIILFVGLLLKYDLVRKIMIGLLIFSIIGSLYTLVISFTYEVIVYNLIKAITLYMLIFSSNIKSYTHREKFVTT